MINLPRKGNLKVCKNYRGIILLSIEGKALGRLVIDRVRNGADSKIRKQQADYSRGGGKTEQVFILWNIIEQVNEWQIPLCFNFINFEKPFDSVHRDGRWVITRKYGIPEKIVLIVKLLILRTVSVL